MVCPMPKRPSGSTRRRRRDRVVKFVARRDEFAAWSKLATDRDLTLSAWIRGLCNDEIKRGETAIHPVKKSTP